MITTDRRSTPRAERMGTIGSEPNPRQIHGEVRVATRNDRPAISSRSFRRMIALSGMAADFIACLFGISASYCIDISLHATARTHYPLREMAVVSILVAFSVVLLLQREGAYRECGNLLQIRETERAIRVTAESLLLVLPFSFLLKLEASRTVFVLAFVLTSALLVLEKHVRSWRIQMLHAREYGIYPDADGLLFTSAVESTPPWQYAIAKRTADVVVSSFLLVSLAPLLLLIGLFVRLDSPGPALFVQKRVGRHGRLFDIYKFRSMYRSASRYDFSPTTSFDPRITRLGRFLRRTCLDELPQLLNVLTGTMSLVGPRPEMPFIVRNYNSRERQRLQVTPGITGMWQLSADRALPIHENVEYDLYYIRNRTFFLDIAILVHTAFFAVGGGV